MKTMTTMISVLTCLALSIANASDSSEKALSQSLWNHYNSIDDAGLDHATTRYTSVAELRQVCGDDRLNSHMCVAFINASISTYQYLEALDALTYEGKSGFSSASFCADHITIREVVIAFLAWADRHPRSQLHSAVSGILSSLNETYPCKMR
jgi:Rap1a immunity proteins